MRVRLALVPLVLGAALLGGCATKTPAATATPTPTVAGNGVAALTAKEIVAKAQAAANDAKSFHIKGAMTENGQTVKLDASVVGKDFAGTFETDGFALDLIVVGNDVYIKAPDAFWAGQVPANLQSALAGLKGKYVKADATKAEFASFKEVIPVNDLLSSSSPFTKGEAKTIAGKPAIAVINDTDKSILYVATEGEPYPLRLEQGAPTASASPSASPSGSASPSASASVSAGTSTGSIDFSEFGTATVKAPDAANVFDLKTITG